MHRTSRSTPLRESPFAFTRPPHLVTMTFRRRYRGVAVATVEAPLTRDGLERHFLGREAYRRTRWVVARRGPAVALVEVRKAGGRGDPLFAPIVEARVLALPGESAMVDAPEVDTGVPSQLARVARERAPGARCVVVLGLAFTSPTRRMLPVSSVAPLSLIVWKNISSPTISTSMNA